MAIMRSPDGRLVITRRAGLGLVALALAGWFGGSLALLSDAGHNLTDVIALATSLIAVRWAVRPPSAEKTWSSATDGARYGPNCASIRDRNRVSRTFADFTRAPIGPI